MNLNFGAMSHSIASQLIEQNIDFSAADCKTWQKDVDAVTLLHIRGFLTDSETHKARQRIIKNIGKSLLNSGNAI